MFSIIDRYISKLFSLYFIAGLLVFVTIFLAVDFMGAFARYDVSIDVLLRYYGYFLPAIIHQMIPVGCLVATVFTLSTLNKTNELTALFSVGMSLARVSIPILTLVSVISAASFWAGDRLLPRFAQKKNYVYYVEIKKQPGLYSTVKTNKIWYRSQNVLFNIRILDAASRVAQGITLYYFDDEWNLKQLIKAKKVKMNGQLWELTDGLVTLFAPERSFPLTKTFKRKSVTMGEDVADLQSVTHSSDVMNTQELKHFIRKNKEAGMETLRYEVDYHSKFGFAFAAFDMSLIGIPFSVNRQRSGGTFMNAGICLGLAFGYWVFFSSAVTMGRYGYLPPLLAAWGPNLLMSGLSIHFLLRLKK